MLRPGVSRVLITTDAVGGVWRYAVDLAAALGGRNIECLLAGFGPPPDASRLGSCALLPNVEVAWLDAPLDWMAPDEAACAAAPAQLAALARGWGADLLHVNAPSHAAGLPDGFEVVVSSHSCVPTWWDCVRGGALPPQLEWHRARNVAGFSRAGAALAPSRAHAASLQRAYGPIPGLRVVCNATEATAEGADGREPLVLAAGRWWDEGKGAAVLDRAAAASPWRVLAAGSLTGPEGQRADFVHAEAPGELSADGVRNLMSRAAIFAAPSRYEPFGLAVLRERRPEAARCCSPTSRASASCGRVRRCSPGRRTPRPGPPRSRASPAIRASAPRLAAAARERAKEFAPERQLAGVLQGYAAASRRASVREVA